MICFFVHRVQTLTKQVGSICGLVCLSTAITAVRTNVANLSDAAMWKIRRARFARNRQKSVRSLRDSVKGAPTESKRAFSLPESLSNRLRESHQSSTRSLNKQCLVPYLRRIIITWGPLVVCKLCPHVCVCFGAFARDK